MRKACYRNCPMKSEHPTSSEPTAFENFDRLFRQVIAVPKAAVVKAEAKAQKRKAQRKKKAAG